MSLQFCRSDADTGPVGLKRVSAGLLSFLETLELLGSLAHAPVPYPQSPLPSL